MFTLMKIKSVVFCVFSFCFSTHIWGQQINLNKHRVALQGYDVVSYFLNNKAVVGNKALIAEYAGAFYHFSTSKNKAQFDANPARFAPQYGGVVRLCDDQRKKSFDQPRGIFNSGK